MKKPYVLLLQQQLAPNLPVQLVSAPSKVQLSAVLSSLGPTLAFDYETKGTDPANPEHDVVSVAFCDGQQCVAVDVTSLDKEVRAFLFDWTASKRLVAHNYAYDGAWLAREVGRVVVPEMDTFGMFKHLANEGWVGQSWSLGTAMTDILGWPESGKTVIEQWLADNKLTKSDMWKAPFETLGYYNGLDAMATWQLYEYFLTFEAKFPVIREYHRVDFINEVLLAIEQQLTGLKLDLDHVNSFAGRLDTGIAENLQVFLEHPPVAAAVAEYNQIIVADIVAAEPPKLKKGGEVAKRWEGWQAKVEEAKQQNHFNTDSPKQLNWLFFDKLKYPVKKKTDKGIPSVDASVIATLGQPGKLLAKYRNLRDERKFVTQLQNVQLNGRIHPSLKIPGPITGRLAGGLPEE